VGEGGNAGKQPLLRVIRLPEVRQTGPSSETSCWQLNFGGPVAPNELPAVQVIRPVFRNGLPAARRCSECGLRGPSRALIEASRRAKGAPGSALDAGFLVRLGSGERIGGWPPA
jgi:hypothetical protein